MLSIQITKRTDGSGVLRCVRADGSMTWQKQKSRHAAFFALHDLTHFAVESALEFRRGFYGLIADGWEIDDTTGKGTRVKFEVKNGVKHRVAVGSGADLGRTGKKAGATK